MRNEQAVRCDRLLWHIPTSSGNQCEDVLDHGLDYDVANEAKSLEVTLSDCIVGSFGREQVDGIILASSRRSSKALPNLGDYVQLSATLASIEPPHLCVREHQFHQRCPQTAPFVFKNTSREITASDPTRVGSTSNRAERLPFKLLEELTKPPFIYFISPPTASFSSTGITTTAKGVPASL
jgi:hypothetical protein